MKASSIAWYIGGAILLSWIPQLLAIHIWGLDSSSTRAVFVGVMWSPTLLALGFLALRPEARKWVRWRLGRPSFLLLGIAVETAIGLLLVGGLVTAGWATSGWFTFHGSAVDVSGGPWLLGHGTQGWPLYVSNIAVTALAYSTFGLVATTGEEFAWRGFLQGHLEAHLGVLRAILTVAAIWWFWHLPGLLAGYNFPRYPVLGAVVLFPLQMLGTSLFFGWLTVRAESFWPAALAHGAVNSVQQGLIDNLQPEVSTIAVDLLRTAMILLVGAICWLALRRSNNRSNTSAAEGAGFSATAQTSGLD